MKLSDEIYIWLTQFKKNSVKASTYDRLLESFRMMCQYSIAEIERTDVTLDTLQSYINELTSDGYALTTIKKQYTLLTAFYKHLIARGEQLAPIYIGVSLPSENRITKKKKEIEVYSAEEQDRIRKVLITLEEPAYAAILLMLECGLRVGEVLALKWSDIDFRRKSIKIHRTLVRLSVDKGKTFVQDSAKTNTSNRTIPLSKIAVETLQKLRELNPETEYLFQQQETLQPISYAALRYVLKKLCTKANVNYLGFHVFRHTFASNCYDKGVDVKILSKILGHADTSITYNTYIHLFGDELEAMRTALA